MSNELSGQELLPPEIGLTLLGFEKSEQGWLVSAEGRTGSECPSCGMQSTARHSRYWRQLQDLPVQGKRVALQLRLSRWRCRNRECEQAIFRERLGEVVAPGHGGPVGWKKCCSWWATAQAAVRPSFS